MVFEVRSAGEPLALVPAIREIVADLDRTIPLEQISTQVQLFKAAITPERIFTYLCSGLALLGVLLSCIGLYGLLAFMVIALAAAMASSIPRFIPRPPTGDWQWAASPARYTQSR